MKRLIPLLITAIGGFVLIVSFFIPAWQEAGEVVAVWFDVLASIAFILGGGNLLAVHLKKISDRAAGWGYSGVTLLAFGLTLWIGLFKVGTFPAPQTEYYGESFAPIPLEALPEFSVAGTLPPRGDGKLLPPSVRVTDPPQLTSRDGRLYFRGWITPAQTSDLLGYHETLEWRSRVEELSELAQPPPSVRGKVQYHPEFGALGFRGVMSASDRQALEALFAGRPAALEAVAALWTTSHRETRLAGVSPPPGFQIPTETAEVVRFDGGTLVVRGPMSEALREQMAVDWVHPRRVRPLPPQERVARQQALEALGSPLTDEQAEVLRIEFDGISSAELLIQALNTAGLAPVKTKTYRELLAEQAAGVRKLVATKPPGESVQLNAAQEATIHRFADDLTMTEEQLVEQLQQAGPFLPAQAEALQNFLRDLPTEAELNRRIAFHLLKLHRANRVVPRPTPAQIEFLLADSRMLAAWRRQVDDLFRRSHLVKFPWSGDYGAPGSPFDWIFRYVFQPVTATMFAMLAFYVASAAFRAFRAKNFEAVLLLGTAFIILLMQTFVGVWLTRGFPPWLAFLQADELKRLITMIFVTSGSRAIMIGIALGVVATSLKILLGVDRSYLGSGDE